MVSSGCGLWAASTGRSIVGRVGFWNRPESRADTSVARHVGRFSSEFGLGMRARVESRESRGW